MVEIFKREYWSTSDTMLLPLTGLSRTTKFDLKSYLFWRDYSIYDYNLIISLYYKDYNKVKHFCENAFFPVLDKKGYLIESYDIGDRTVFILDMSEWAMDIEMFLVGKYSKFSSVAKTMIKDYHAEISGYKKTIPQNIYTVLFPNEHLDILGGKSAIEYSAEQYNLDSEMLTKLGEIGNKYDKIAETLFTEVDELSHFG